MGDLLVLLAEVRAVSDAVDQQLRDALQALLPIIDLGDQRGAALHHLSRELLACLVVFVDKLHQHFRMIQLLSQAGEYAFLHAVEVIGLGARARATVTVPRAFQTSASRLISALGRHAAAAVAAFQQARKQALRSLRLAGVFEGPLLRPDDLLHAVEKLLVDHAVLGGVVVAPLVWRVGPADPLSGVRVFDHPVLVPHDLTHIELVAEYAGAALGPAIDGAGCPGLAPWGRNALGLQFGRQMARRLAFREIPEDALHDLDLFRDCDQLSLVRWVGFEAVCLPASRQAALHQTLHTAPHLAGVVLAEELGDDGSEAHRDGRGRTFMDTYDLDAKELHPLVDARHVFHVAGYAVDLFDHDHVKQAVLGVGQQV